MNYWEGLREGERETENKVENESCAKPNLSNNLSSFSSISKNTLSTGSHFQRRTKTLTSTLTSNQDSTLNSNSSNRRKVYKLARIFNNSKIQNRNDAKMFVDKVMCRGAVIGQPVLSN